jgi:type I restriction-modification system DNA methylase subunit
LSPLRQQVRRERAVQEADADFGNKRPDYSFRDNTGRDIFYLEAKRPSIDVNADKIPAIQVRTYGWHGKLKIGIVTDFEEFAVFDCRVPIQANDNALTARTDYFLYGKYTDITTFKYLWEYFEQSNVQKGSLDRYLQDARNNFAKQAKPVDDAFLESLQTWRKDIAMAIFKNNPNLTIEQLNYIVQITLNRIIFLRNCEDRNIEPTATLHSIVNPDKKQIDYGYDVQLRETLFHQNKKYDQGLFYKRLLNCFEFANNRYNAGLFDLSAYNGLAYRISIDNDSLKNILEGLYFPVSPYCYDLIDTDILGSAYERFLGEVLIIKDKINTKGQYTTETATGKRAKEVISELKPDVRKAGGVFYTPQYVVRYIIENTIGKLIQGKTPEQISRLSFCDPSCGSGSFLIGVYKYLIEYHIDYYGKIAFKQGSTKNLPLTTKSTLTVEEKKRILVNNIYGVDIDAQAIEVTKLSLMLTCLEDASENDSKNWAHILPNLDINIQCGDSLIDATFNWNKQFPRIFKNGGFDAIVGNPPYGASLDEEDKAYLKAKYKTFGWRGETYILFTEKASNLLKINGLLGYIIPDTYLNLDFTKPMRDFLLQNTIINEIVALPSNVFKDATVDTTILLVEKQKETTTFHKTKTKIITFNKKLTISNVKEEAARTFEISTQEWFLSNSFNVQSDKTETKLIQNIDAQFKTINDIAEMFYGIKAYQVGKGKPAQTAHIRDTKPFTANTQKTKEWKPMYDGKHIGRYSLLWDKNNWIHYGQWLAEPRQPKKYEGEKILIRKIISDTLIATYVPDTSYCNTLLFVLKLKENTGLNYLYVLGILNSKFIGWYFRKKFQIASDDTFPQIMIRDILQFAIPTTPNKTTHDKLTTLVSTVLTNKAAGKNTEKEEKYIDELVYQLYNLSKEDIEIIKNG